MAHLVETMAYAGAVPWHGLGQKVNPDMSPQEMVEAAGINWTVSKRAAYFPVLPHVTNLYDPTETCAVQYVPDTSFIVRDTDNKVLSSCGGTYVPFQNADVMDFFTKFTQAGHMTMETAGSLKDGKEIWGLAKITDGFKLAGGDEVSGYLLLNNSHVPGKALLMMFTAIRVVCNNTLQMALKSAKTGRTFKVPHMQQFDAEVIKSAETALGLSNEAMDLFKQQSEFLASRPAKKFDVERWLAEILQPQLLVERAKSDNQEALPPLADQLGRNAKAVLEAIETSPGADLKSAKGTWWGALNGLTYAIDHKKTGAEGNALYSAWFGSGSKLKTEGLELALEMAK